MFEPTYALDTPVQPKGAARVVRKIPLNPLHEAIASEIREDPSIMDRVQEHEWPRLYWESPTVIDAQARGERLPLPIILYLDGVRFTAPLVGRSDSILGIWGFNAITQRRHYLFSLRTQDFCRCGCRGWCTLWEVFTFIV